MEEKKLIKLDIGCGPNKKEGFIGIDQYEMPGVDIVCKLGEKWPIEDESVTEFHCSHVLEHLTNFEDKWERTNFFNELYRVLVKGKYENGKPVEGFGTLIFPHWASQRYYGDPTHKEPFSEMGFYYLSTEWRATQAPHSDIKWNKNGYNCDFQCTWGYSMRQDLLSRNQEFQNYAMTNFKEACQDIVATIVKK
jgi:hypothetical protein